MSQQPDEQENDASAYNWASRRQFLAATAATGTLIGVGSAAFAQQGPDVKLGGKVQGWIGRAPAAIEGETNPTLTFQSGQEVTLVWENLDGLRHNFVIEDADGNDLVATEIISGQGTTQQVTFTASTEMAEYYCEVHPTTMRGQVQVTAGMENTPTPTPTPTEQPPEEDMQEDDGGRKYFFPTGPSVGVETVAGDGILTAPTDFAVANEATNRRFVTDQTGQIYGLTADGLRDEPFMDISQRMVDLTWGGYDERGLLGLEFHPNFETNRRFYVHYSAPPNENTPEGYDHVEVISEFEATANGARGRPETECKLLQIQHPQTNHDAGPMAFGPKDGYLYIPMGDGGGAGDNDLGHVEDWYERNEGGNGQDIYENLLGNIIRIDVDGQEGGKPYAIPDDNPLVGTEGIDELYAWGFRNPFGISFDSESRLFVADAGQNLFEEANIIEKGGNYGWNVKEATHCFSTAHPNEPFDECPDSVPEDVPGMRGGEELIDPIVEYPHTYKGHSVGQVIIGGGVYENDIISSLQGKYIFGEWSQTVERPAGRLMAASPDTDNDPIWRMEELLIGGDRGLNWFVRMFGIDAVGDMYVLVNKRSIIAGNTGAVLKLVPA